MRASDPADPPLSPVTSDSKGIAIYPLLLQIHVSEKKYIFPSRLTTGGTVIIRRDEWITPFSRGSFRSKSNTFHGMGNEMKDGG